MRITSSGEQFLEQAMARHKVTASVVVRAMLATAASHPDEVTKRIAAAADVAR